MIRKQCWTLFTICLTATAAHASHDAAFTVRGRVLDATAKPVANAAIRLMAPGFYGFDVDEKTATDADGRFRIAAPRSWTLMDASQRQELALLAVQGNRIAAVQFNRSSAPPASDVELKFVSVPETKLTILAPDLRPVVGAKVKLAALLSDTIFVGLTEEQVQQWGRNVRKTPIGHAIGTSTVSLPLDLQVDLGRTDAGGMVAVPNLAASAIGAVTVQADEFGEQSVGYYPLQGAKPPGWPRRIVFQKTGRVVGQLTSPIAEAVTRREVTLMSFQQDQATGIFCSSSANVVTDAEGKFEVTKTVAGSVRVDVKFDPAHPTRPEQAASMPQLKAGETLRLKIALKPAVRVDGRALEADSRKPIRNVRVRAFLGVGFESAISDADGKFVFWMPAGETAFHPEVPEEYLPAVRPSDYYDAAKRQQSLTIFKVPEAKSFEAPPILLQRAATLRGVVADDQGRPLPASRVSAITMSLERRTGQPKPREIVVQPDEHGQFSIPGIDPREAVRLRVTAREVSKIVTVAKPGSGTVRVIITPNERFHISGQVTDAEGKPLAGAMLEVWHRDWRPAPAEGEAKKLEFKAPIRADAEGRFQTPPLTPDGHYRFTIRAAGTKTTESAWLDATKPDAAQPQQLVVTRLRGVSGVIRDRAAKPIADVQVSLCARETRTETTTNGQGEFKLETPAGKPFCVIVRHPDFRVGGSYYEQKPPNLDQTMVRLTEPAEMFALRPILAKEDREKMFQRLFEPIKQQLAKSANTDEKMRTLQSLTGIAPEFVVEFLDKHPLQPAMYQEMLLTQVAMKSAARRPDEVEEVIGRMSQGWQKSLTYGRLVDALPEKARPRKLELLAEALISARSEKTPEFRVIALGQVANRLLALGDKERATALLHEGEKTARGLSTSEFAGYARGCFATDFALIDLPTALALIKDLKDRREFARHHGNIAHRLARIHPADAVRVLDLIPPPQQNDFNQRDQYGIRVCYRMAQVELPAALNLANSIVDLPSRAYALGVIAQAVAKNEPKQATDLLRRAFNLVEEEAARPDSPQLTSPLIPGSVAAALLLSADQVDATLVRECLWRSVTLQRPYTEDAQQFWRYTTGNNALAMAAARYDGKLAEFLLAAASTQYYSREAQLAAFLTNPQRAVASAEKGSGRAELRGGAVSVAPKSKDRELLQLLGYVATEEDRVPQLILNTLGIWRIDVEDIDI